MGGFQKVCPVTSLAKKKKDEPSEGAVPAASREAVEVAPLQCK